MSNTRRDCPILKDENWEIFVSELWDHFKLIVLIPNSIVSTFLSGRMKIIFPENLTFAKQHLSLGGNIAMHIKKRVIESIWAKFRIILHQDDTQHQNLKIEYRELDLKSYCQVKISSLPFCVCPTLIFDENLLQ